MQEEAYYDEFELAGDDPDIKSLTKYLIKPAIQTQHAIDNAHTNIDYEILSNEADTLLTDLMRTPSGLGTKGEAKGRIREGQDPFNFAYHGSGQIDPGHFFQEGREQFGRPLALDKEALREKLKALRNVKDEEGVPLKVYDRGAMIDALLGFPSIEGPRVKYQGFESQSEGFLANLLSGVVPDTLTYEESYGHPYQQKPTIERESPVSDMSTMDILKSLTGLR